MKKKVTAKQSSIKHPEKRGAKRKPDVCRVCGAKIKRIPGTYKERICHVCANVSVMTHKWSKKSNEEINARIKSMHGTIILLQRILIERSNDNE
jgi:hypothetical protein